MSIPAVENRAARMVRRRRLPRQIEAAYGSVVVLVSTRQRWPARGRIPSSVTVVARVLSTVIAVCTVTTSGPEPFR
jgi:hypothetical protein